MARIPYREAVDAKGDTKVLLESVDANIAKMVAQAQAVAPHLLKMVGAMLTELQLPATLRELATLLVGRHTGASYEWAQHVRIAKATGVTDEQLSALERDDLDADCFDERDRAVLAFALEVLEVPRPSDAAYDRLTEAGLETEEIVELVLVVGAYQMLAHVMTTFDIDEEPAISEDKFDATMKAISEG
jgi:alkylhydroperoxidase family enzyme